MRLKSACGALATIGVLCAGCSDDDDKVGTLQQQWTIGGTTDPNACTLVGASQVRIVVLDPGLFVQATQFASCGDFRSFLTLDDNNYTASLTFLDGNGVAVSDTRGLAAFSIFENQTTTVNIDFPLTAFF